MLVDELGRFIAETRYEDLPSSIVKTVKMRVLDLLGAALAGFQLGLYRPLFEILGGRAEATVWGEGIKYPLQSATLLNSFMAHSSAFEDGSRYTGGHPSSVVIPSAFSLGEVKGSDGKEIILSVALGYDVFLRMGRAIYPSTVVRGFQSTAVLGSVASSAACAKLLKLDREGCKNALAIASNLGTGLKEALKAPESQPIQVGRSCEGGLLAALYAAKGAKGCDTILENGFLKAYADKADDKAILSDLGKRFRIEETYVKIHGGCRGNHAPIDVVQDLVRKHRISFEEIKEIRVKVDSVTMAADILDPQNGKQAQFSIPFSIAVALIEGNASIYQYTDGKLNDPRIRSMITKITVDVDKDLDRDFPDKRGARGEIVLTNGERLSSSIDMARGEPEFPLSSEEIEEKFLLLTKEILGRRAEEICGEIKNLEKLKDISKFVPKLALQGK